jgi:hypothetical protein
MGKMFEMRKDHNGMKYLFDHPTLNVRHSRWLEFLSEYDFDRYIAIFSSVYKYWSFTTPFYTIF